LLITKGSVVSEYQASVVRRCESQDGAGVTILIREDEVVCDEAGIVNRES